MRNLSLEDFCQYYSSRCQVCNGDRKIEKNGVDVVCSCQDIANIKWRLEQLRVHPPELKLKTWDDFTGIIKSEDIQTGMLTLDSAVNAKSKALAYCYANGDNSSPRNLILHKRAAEGANLIIGGGKNTGKTLLGVLVIKEIIRTSVVHRINLSFEWVKSSELKEAARWDNHRPVNHARLSELADVDFLVIDEVEMEQEVIGGRTYHKTNPPDRTSVNILFGQRDMYHRPTILICSQRFLSKCLDPLQHDDIQQQWGQEFLHILTNKKNTFIYLERENIGDTAT